MRRAGRGQLTRRGGVREGKRLGPRRTIVAVFHVGETIFSTAWVKFECGHEGRTYAQRSAPMPGAYGHCRVCLREEATK